MINRLHLSSRITTHTSISMVLLLHHVVKHSSITNVLPELHHVRVMCAACNGAYPHLPMMCGQPTSDTMPITGTTICGKPNSSVTAAECCHHTACQPHVCPRDVHFDRPSHCCRPVCTAEARHCDLFKVLGLMVTHSIAQDGMGFPYFSLNCYWYMMGGEEKRWNITFLSLMWALML